MESAFYSLSSREAPTSSMCFYYRWFLWKLLRYHSSPDQSGAHLHLRLISYKQYFSVFLMYVFCNLTMIWVFSVLQVMQCHIIQPSLGEEIDCWPAWLACRTPLSLSEAVSQSTYHIHWQGNSRCHHQCPWSTAFLSATVHAHYQL